ncbi:hypothetical protein F5883DRAFT_582969 [Diaporthe sp. PMI_573]|nr:hypothetical protein F5883DRAFT_582969 [Diaporthaceae sp. PMI_573]
MIQQQPANLCHVITKLTMVSSTEQPLSIIVVGGGIGGLSFATEAHLRGHKVRVFERRPNAASSGEMLLVSNSATRAPKKWSGFLDRVQKVAPNAQGMFKKWDGTPIAPLVYGDANAQSMLISRGNLHTVLAECAAEQGVPIEYNAAAQDFFETESQGGVILTDGRKFTADLVIASDGIGSKSWRLFEGSNTAPVSSGFVVYRITYPTKEALKYPAVAAALQEKKERGENGGFFHAGPDSHFMSCMVGEEMCWMLTCRDHNSDAEESWSKPTTTANALEAVKGWDPYVVELIKAVPNDTVYDWKMMWRDPQPQWVSKGGRVVQLGDAAHPFLPTSGSGATMAMEDAWTLAVCLEKAGKDNLTLATRVHNKLRFERVSAAQKLGFVNRESLHKTDWDFVMKNPEILGKMFHRKWLVQHDPEQYALENYDAVAEHLLKGTPFVSTNHVPGYTYKPWSVQELLEASEKGINVEDEGDWM